MRPEYGSHAKDGPQGNQRFIDMGDQAGQSFDGYGTDLRRRNSGHASSERNRREQDGRQVQPPSNIDSRQPPSWRNSAENYGETQQYHTGGGGGGYDHRQTDHDSQQYSGSGYSHSNVSNADYGIRGGADARIRGQSSNVPEPPHKLIDRGFGHQHNNLSRPSSARSRSRSRGRRSRSRGRRSRSRGRRSRSRSRGRDSYRRRRKLCIKLISYGIKSSGSKKFACCGTYFRWEEGMEGQTINGTVGLRGDAKKSGSLG